MYEKKFEEFCELLLNTCLGVKDSLFISCNKFCLRYAEGVVEYAKKIGVDDIFLDIVDYEAMKQVLSTTPYEEIKTHSFFIKDKWNEYAEKNASFLILKTEVPNFFDDVEPKKLIEAMRVTRENQSIYKAKQLSYQIPWCISAVPNNIWAKELFPNSENAEEELLECIYNFCFINGDGKAVKQWRNQREKNNQLVRKLNSLKIEKLIYQSKKGTNLEIELSPNANWMGLDKGNMIVNMPSYEVYSVPHCEKINGVVFSTKPLVYNGILIEDFMLEFKKGKIVNVIATKGEKALKELIFSVKGADTLGEVAVVDNRSPISQSNMNFGLTLLDENASCHFALGNAYPACLKNYYNLTDEDLKEEGFNKSKIHVDFMVGDSGLKIEMITNKGRITLMEKGEIVL